MTADRPLASTVGEAARVAARPHLEPNDAVSYRIAGFWSS
jgi:hypothetical protein